MARRKKQEVDPVAALFMLLMIGSFLLVFNATKSLMAGAVAAGVILGLFLIVGLMLKAKREERLKRSGIADIDKMDGRQFEHYLGHLFKSYGYSVNVTRAAGDYGADLVISKGGKRTVVQAKRYSKNVGIKAVQEAQAAIAHYGATDAWVVSNRDYTEAAYALAKSNKVKLINREQLIEMILKLNPGTAPSSQQVVTELPKEAKTCTRCGAEMVRRKGPRGDLYACSTFPMCRVVVESIK